MHQGHSHCECTYHAVAYAITTYEQGYIPLCSNDSIIIFTVNMPATYVHIRDSIFV